MKSHRLTTKRPSRKQRPTGEATAPHIERADAPVQSLETLRNPHADAAGRGRAALGLQRVVGNAAIGHLVSNVAVQMMPKSHVDVVDIYREQPAVSQAEAAVNTNVDSRERRLAERITELARNGGITVSVYIDPVKISGKPVKGAAEFERQASQFADDHGAIGLSANGLQIGAAMQLSQSLPSLLQSLNVRLEELLAHHRDLGGLQSSQVPVQTLAIFTHGTKNQLQAGARAEWIKNDLATWVEAIVPFLAPSPQILLFACSTAGVPSRGLPFAEAMREELQKQLEHRYGVDGGIAPEVWGHSTAHHTTGNVNLVGFQGGAVSSTGMALLTVLGRRMAQLVMETMGLDSLTNAQSDKIYDMSRSAIKRVLTPRTGRLDATNTYFREIPQLGIDRVWQDVSTPYSPDFSNLNLTEGATLRMARGAEEYQQRFLNEVEKLKQHVIRVTAQRR